ncbi:MAG TPA: hypothetical protein VIX83_00190 [Candidatus Cybelea sp.]
MRNSSGRHWWMPFGIVAAIVGCNARSPVATLPVASANSGRISERLRFSVSRTESKQKTAPRMDVSAKKLDLLYISDASSEVTVYTYWQKSLVGQLTGFVKPRGECVDAAGNVYITDAGADAIVEYAHAAKKPLRTIDESPLRPNACAFDRTTGDLAVANTSEGSKGAGNVAIYARGSGEPAFYSDRTVGNFTALAYDNRGDLLTTNGASGNQTSKFAWLPKNGSKLIDLRIPGPSPSSEWKGVAGIQWDGQYFVLDGGALFQISLLNGVAYYVGETQLDEFGGYPGSAWIYNANPKKQGTQVVIPYGNGGVSYFNYPAGGDAIASLYKGLSNPVGVTVSLAKNHEY